MRVQVTPSRNDAGHTAHRRREKQIERGVQAVRSGMAYRAAANKYHVAKSTIWNRMKRSHDFSDKKSWNCFI